MMNITPGKQPKSRSELLNEPGTYFLAQRFVLAAVIVALLTMAGFGTLLYLLSNVSTHADLINQAEHQRMLSQHISLYAERLVADPTNGEVRQQLRQALESMSTAHEYLQQHMLEDAPFQHAAFLEFPLLLDRQVGGLLVDGRNILNNPATTPSTLAPLKRAENRVIQSLQTLAQRLEQDTTQRNRYILSLGFFLSLGTLGMLVIIALYIIKPALRQLDRERQRLQASEDQFRTISESLPVMIALGDRDLRYRFVNPGYAESLKRPREDIIGHKLEDILGADFVRAEMPRFQAVLRGETLYFDDAINLPEGERHFQMAYLPYRSHGGEIDGILFAALDISERKEREITLREARDTAEQARRLMEAFVANISHEIRTPLNAVVGFTELLSREALPDTAHRQVETIQAGARSLLQLINDLLDLSKLEAGRMSTRPRPTDLHQMLEDIKRLFSTQAEAKGLYMQVNLDDGKHQPLLDESLLRQILLNLVGNAVKFTSTGGIKLYAQLYAAVDSPGYTLELTVTDTGPGIEMEFQEMIFEPFRQRDSGLNRRHGGIGLGLSISRHLAELLGGELTVISEAGRGSTFRLSISNLSVFVGNVEKPAIAPASVPRFARLTVLVVEDDPARLTLVVALCQMAGLVVETANNGQEALESIRSLYPALVLLNMQMMDSYTLLWRLKATPELSSIPVVGCTAIDMHDHDPKIRELCAELIRNPLESEELLRVLTKWLPLEQAAEALVVPPLPPEVRGKLQIWLEEIHQHKTLSKLGKLAKDVGHLGKTHNISELVTLGEGLEQAVAQNHISAINQQLKTLKEQLRA